MVRFLFALFDFRCHHLNDDPGTQCETSHECLPLRHAVHFAHALSELFEDLLSLIVQPLLQILLVPDNVTEQLGLLTASLKVHLAWADVAVP